MQCIELTKSTLAPTAMVRLGLSFRRYDKRLPFAIYGMTMYGESPASMLTPMRFKMLGWLRAFIFRLSSISSLTSFREHAATGEIILSKQYHQ